MKIRILVILTFYLQCSLVKGQPADTIICTLKEAMKDAFQNNPTIISDSSKRNLSCEIKSAWYCWLYRIQKYQILHEYQHELDDLNRITSLRFQAGEDEPLETMALLARFEEVQTIAAISFNDIDISRNQLRQLIFSEKPIAPADSSLSLYEIDKGFAFGMPEITIEDTTALFRYRIFIRTSSIENKQLELDNLFIRLQYYNTYGLTLAAKIIHVAKARYKSEDIDYPEYTNKLAEAYRLKLEYIEILNDYNQSAIQLEHYAY